MRLFTFYLALALLLGSCASTKVDPVIDPNEYLVAGYVTHREKVTDGEEPESIEMSNTGKFLTTMIIGVGTAVATGYAYIPLFSYSDERPGKAYKYHVKLENGKTLGLLNHSSGFNIDDCVTVFLSEDLVKYPPRMAYGNLKCDF